MSMSSIGATAAAVRESARRSNGRFGEQHHPDPGQVGLGPAPENHTSMALVGRLERSRADVEIQDAMLAERKVSWLDIDDRVCSGTVRGGLWTPDGTLAPHGVAAADACIRITDNAGFDRYLPWEQAVDAHRAHAMEFE